MNEEQREAAHAAGEDRESRRQEAVPLEAEGRNEYTIGELADKVVLPVIEL